LRKGFPVRYIIQYAASVKPYLRNAPLSREGRIKVWAFIHSVIAGVSDVYRTDPVNRLVGTARFKMHFVFREGGRFRAADFIINDSAAAYGVLTIAYVDVLWQP
jgi:hypothetical protein